MLAGIESPLSFQIALGVQFVVALILLPIRGWRSSLVFVLFCPILWFLSLGLASLHIIWAFEVLWVVPVLWLLVAAIRPIRPPALLVATLIACSAVATQLFPWPPSQVEGDLTATRLFLERMKEADPRLLTLPEVSKHIRQSEQILADPSDHTFVVWTEWTGLLSLVLLGFWGAYGLYRKHPRALLVVAVASMLFFARKLIFDNVVYRALFQGNTFIPYLFDRREFRTAAWIIWWDYLLPLLFLYIFVASLALYARNKSRGSDFP